MRIAVVRDHSKGNAALARLTAQNHWDYSARHGYDLITWRIEWEDARWTALHRVHRLLLNEYDAVLKIGSDVVITNPEMELEKMIADHDGGGCLMSREIEGRSPINNDVVLWIRSIQADRLINKILFALPTWVDDEAGAYWQGFIARRPELLRLIDICPPRKLNSTDQTGEWLWEPGDFVCHCLGGDIQSKIERVKAVLAKL